jgi:4-amino-4-deoxy-L-arabinose transferase-like glycosyltransferase
MHPPTYVYLLALFIFLFKESVYSIRAVSALFSIGVLILIFLITKKILENKNTENSESWALLAAFLYAINPFAIQSSIIVDIDGGLLNFFILLFLYLYIEEKSFFYLIPSLFMVFASKLIGPVMLFASLFLLNLGIKDYKNTLKTILLFFITGFLFFLSFFIYTKVFDLSMTPLLRHGSIIGVLKNFLINYSPMLLRSFWGFKSFIYFITPFLFFLFMTLSLIILLSIFSYKSDYTIKNKNILLLWIFIIMNLLFLIVLSGNAGWNFPKYYITILAPLIILVICFTPKKIMHIEKIIPVLLLTIFLLSVYFIIFIKDPLIPEIQGRISTIPVISVIKPVLIRFTLYFIIPVLLCFFLLVRIPKKGFWIILFFLVFFTSIYLDIIQAKADYSTHNLYGDKGLKEVIEYMKDKPPSEILCYVHVGFYLGYYETYELTTLYYDKPALIKALNEKNIKYIILYQKDIDSIGKEILKGFKLDLEIGDYKILKRTF